jgi:hypothetical protein
MMRKIGMKMGTKKWSRLRNRMIRMTVSKIDELKELCSSSDDRIRFGFDS